VSDAQTIFGFESDFAGSLYCIPMSVRLKLDEVGVKVSLKHWNKLSREERDQLLIRPCDAEPSRRSYRDYLVAALKARTGAEAQALPIEPDPAWADAGRVPAQVSEYFRSYRLVPLSQPQWSGLTPLQRFVLIKLTRPGHSNDNLLPALREFGLLKDSA
jgi:hypothetical protein